MTRQQCPLCPPALFHSQEAGALLNVNLGFLESYAFEAHGTLHSALLQATKTWLLALWVSTRTALFRCNAQDVLLNAPCSHNHTVLSWMLRASGSR